MPTSPLFEATTINGLTLSNRFVRSATWEGMATEDGRVTPKLIDTMTALAQGGVGLIVSGHAYVDRIGQASPWQMGIYDDSLIEGLQAMTAAVHNAGGRIVAQLAHAGHFGLEKAIGAPPVVASVFDGLAETPRSELTIGAIDELKAAYVAAARRARAAGFDGIQLHSAHGYLLSQFLSPWFNRRTDAYGGTVDNRVRLHVAIITAIRQAVGGDFPMLVKMNCEDFADGGLTVAESIEAARQMEAAGLDAVELSGGLLTGGKLSPSRPNINKPEKEAYFQEAARAFKQALDVPLILVGGIRSPAVAKRLLEEKSADYFAMSRPLIREPDLVNRWRSGDRSPARCLSDNLCFRPGMTGDGIYCVTEKREKK
ncbi:NADH-dependent flavin oxidoreductase [Desulfosarcina alkanivorans]|uniref:NADH-dependent flavin oxidoreductase n=1 Tax=Desulfosarcina alkanivorans TaxID=571177 RepID=A0A5K7YSR5_9BACT|nr:NADH:flavin oxidoreductase [Desulfosarcina alkanivorans]BBO70041.1 NADH-dependent flavin oxidoreductase [Desulfosarcina alkanivorans]